MKILPEIDHFDAKKIVVTDVFKCGEGIE